MGVMEREGVSVYSFLFLSTFLSLFVFLPPVIWRQSSVIFGGCSGRPPLGGAPRRPPERPSCSRWIRCCRPWAAGGPQPDPPVHLPERDRERDRERDTERETERDRERDTERERQRETERDRKRETMSTTSSPYHIGLVHRNFTSQWPEA